MRIREFVPSDLDQVLALSQKYAFWDVTITRADIMGFHSSAPELFLVAAENDKVVGFVYGKESNYPEEVLRNRGATKAASIEILAVSPEHRQQGIATRLVNSLFDIFKNNKIDYVSLAVPAREEAARKLYVKMGFETHAFFMSKRL